MKGWNSKSKGWGKLGSVDPPVPPVSLYQEWDSYPDSPLLTTDYPYQFLFDHGGVKKLVLAKYKCFRYNSTSNIYIQPYDLTSVLYTLSGDTWTLVGNYNTYAYTTLLQANNDIYTNNTYTTVYFAKTTL